MGNKYIVIVVRCEEEKRGRLLRCCQAFPPNNKRAPPSLPPLTNPSLRPLCTPISPQYLPFHISVLLPGGWNFDTILIFFLNYCGMFSTIFFYKKYLICLALFKLLGTVPLIYSLRITVRFPPINSTREWIIAVRI